MSINVLWVEDERESLLYEINLAKRQNWEITFVDNVKNALDRIKDYSYDLIVLDLILPADNYSKLRRHVDPNVGLEFINTIRDPTRIGCTRSDVRLLVLSAVASDDRKAKVVEKLESDKYYLNKPLHEEIYNDIIKEITQSIMNNINKDCKQNVVDKLEPVNE
jgi:CheY-like chemotaxis protein